MKGKREMRKAPFEYDIRRLGYDGRVILKVDAGYRGHERIIPPAGEEYAFSRPTYARSVEVYISPTGSSVRVWVDGMEVKKPMRGA